MCERENEREGEIEKERYGRKIQTEREIGERKRNTLIT